MSKKLASRTEDAFDITFPGRSFTSSQPHIAAIMAENPFDRFHKIRLSTPLKLKSCSTPDQEQTSLLELQDLLAAYCILYSPSALVAFDRLYAKGTSIYDPFYLTMPFDLLEDYHFLALSDVAKYKRILTFVHYARLHNDTNSIMTLLRLDHKFTADYLTRTKSDFSLTRYLEALDLHCRGKKHSEPSRMSIFVLIYMMSFTSHYLSSYGDSAVFFSSFNTKFSPRTIFTHKVSDNRFDSQHQLSLLQAFTPLATSTSGVGQYLISAFHLAPPHPLVSEISPLFLYDLLPSLVGYKTYQDPSGTTPNDAGLFAVPRGRLFRQSVTNPALLGVLLTTGLLSHFDWSLDFFDRVVLTDDVTNHLSAYVSSVKKRASLSDRETHLLYAFSLIFYALRVQYDEGNKSLLADSMPVTPPVLDHQACQQTRQADLEAHQLELAALQDQLKQERLKTSSLTASVEALTKDNSALTTQNRRLQLELADLTQQVKDLSFAKDFDTTLPTTLEEDPANALDMLDFSVLQGIRGAFVGGHVALRTRLSELLPDFTFLDTDNTDRSITHLRHFDVVCFFPWYLNHTMYRKVVEISRNYGVPSVYLKRSSNMTLLLTDLVTQLKDSGLLSS